MVVFNISGLIIAGLAVGLPALVAHWLGWDNSRTAHHNLAYVAAALFVVLDLPLRYFGWRRIITKASTRRIITPDGPVTAPRKPVMDLLEALLSGEAGAQYFWVFPGWLTGVLICALAAAGYLP